MVTFNFSEISISNLISFKQVSITEEYREDSGFKNVNNRKQINLQLELSGRANPSAQYIPWQPNTWQLI